jgi:citrate synthase
MTSPKDSEIRGTDVSVGRTPVVAVEEIPSRRNPYLAEDVRTHGYSVRELAGRVSFSEMLFLALRGELPTGPERRLFDEVLVALTPLGARHPAVRAAMYASVGKTVHQNILPLALSVLGGEHLGAKECLDAMKWVRRSLASDARTCADELYAKSRTAGRDGKPAPGFGSRFDGCDPLPAHFLARLARRKHAGPHVIWANRFARRLEPKGMGALATGFAAAAFLDLGFTEAQGCGVFQVAATPHIIALAAEIGGKGLKAMPFLPDDRYHIVKEGA